MVIRVMPRRQDQAASLQTSNETRQPFGVRPEVNLVGREDGEQESGKAGTQGDCHQPGAQGGSEPPADSKDRHQSQADVAVDLDEVVASHQHRVAMVLAKGVDDQPPDDRCVDRKEAVAEPVHEPRREIGCEIADRYGGDRTQPVDRRSKTGNEINEKERVENGEHDKRQRLYGGHPEGSRAGLHESASELFVVPKDSPRILSQRLFRLRGHS